MLMTEAGLRLTLLITVLTIGSGAFDSSNTEILNVP